MGRVAKSVSEKVADLEGKISGIEGALNKLIETMTVLTQPIPETPKVDAPSETSPVSVQEPVEVEAEKIGKVGRELPAEVPANVLDNFLFNEGPELIAKLAAADGEAAAKVTDWLVSDDCRSAHFFLLWFAAPDEIRKYLFFMLVLRNPPVSAIRFNFLKDMLSEEAIEEVKAAYRQYVENSSQQIVSPQAA